MYWHCIIFLEIDLKNKIHPTKLENKGARYCTAGAFPN